MRKLVGLTLIILGIYSLSQNIIFATKIIDHTSYVAAIASIFTIMIASISLLFFTKQAGSFGLTLLATGAVMVFLSDGFLFQPNVIRSFCLTFIAFVMGFELIYPSKI